jgi:hypothetical protein
MIRTRICPTMAPTRCQRWYLRFLTSFSFLLQAAASSAPGARLPCCVEYTACLSAPKSRHFSCNYLLNSSHNSRVCCPTQVQLHTAACLPAPLPDITATMSLHMPLTMFYVLPLTLFIFLLLHSFVATGLALSSFNWCVTNSAGCFLVASDTNWNVNDKCRAVSFF